MFFGFPVRVADARQSSEEEEELTLSDAGVVEKYKLAGNVVNTVMAAVIALVKVSDQPAVHEKPSFSGFFFFSVAVDAHGTSRWAPRWSICARRVTRCL